LVVVDNGAHTIRTIAPDGRVQTLAGGPGNEELSVDGTGSEARFSFPEGVALDDAGNIYVTQRFSGRLRKVTPSGVVTTEFTFADAGWPLREWGDVSVDGSGRIFIADLGLAVVRMAVPVDPGVPNPPTVPIEPNVPGPVTPEPNSGARLVNLSVRSRSGAGDETLIMGFVVSGGGSKEVLLR
jgi:hypothetical protein